MAGLLHWSRLAAAGRQRPRLWLLGRRSGKWHNGLARTRAQRADGVRAAVTSLHADGRIRQRATQVLASTPGVLRAAPLALHCLDHVPQVREDALLGLRAQTSLDAAVTALSVLLIGRQRQDAEVVLDGYIQALLGAHDERTLLATLRASADRAVRRWAFETSHARELLSTDEFVDLVRRETDQSTNREPSSSSGRLVLRQGQGEPSSAQLPLRP